MAEQGGESWGSLFKVAAITLLLAPLTYIFSQVIQAIINTLPYPVNTEPGQGFTTFLDFIGSHTSLFNAEYELVTLAVLLFVPATIALSVALRKADAGLSAIGGTVTFSGLIFVLLSAVFSFTEIQEAAAWDSGCTTCGNTPIYEAAGTVTGGTSLQVGGLLLFIGILILSLAMLRGGVFSKSSAYLGIITALVAIAVSFATSSLDGNVAVAVGLVPFVLITLWGVSLYPRLLKLR